MHDYICDKMVSLIIPVYNIEDYIDKCLTSVVNQTYKNLEILVMEGRSTDNSLEWVLTYAKMDERIAVISRKDGGLGPARNYALKVAQGEYVCFLDGDDWLSETYVEEAMRYAADDVDMIQTAFYRSYHDGSTLYCGSCCADGTEEDDVSHKNYMLYGNNSMWGKLIRRDLFERYGIIQSTTPFEDLSVYPALVAGARRIASANRAVMYYRENRQGSLLGNESAYLWFNEVFRWSEDMLRRTGNEEKYRKIFDYTMFRHMENIYRRCLGDHKWEDLFLKDNETNAIFKEHYRKYMAFKEQEYWLYGGFSLRWVIHRLPNGKEGLLKHFAHRRLLKDDGEESTSEFKNEELDASSLGQPKYLFVDFMNECEGSSILPDIGRWKDRCMQLTKAVKKNFDMNKVVLFKNYYADTYQDNGKRIAYPSDVKKRNLLLEEMYGFFMKQMEGVKVFEVPQNLRYTDMTGQTYEPSPEYYNANAYNHMAHLVEIAIVEDII